MDMLETKKELKAAAVSQAGATILREWKEVKANDKETQKYIDLYEEGKRLYKLDWQRYQEDHIDEEEIISLHKR